jgi:hypothetical protein
MEHSQSIAKKSDSGRAAAGSGRPEVAEPVPHPLLRLQAAVGNRAVGNLASDVWSGATNLAGDVASGVSDVAGDLWSGAKSVAGGVADFGAGVYGQMKEDAGYVQKGVGAVGEGIDWLEDEAKSGTSWLADKAEGIPVLEQLAGAGKGIVDTSVDITGGALKGVTGLAGGVLSAEHLRRRRKAPDVGRGPDRRRIPQRTTEEASHADR